MILEACSLNAVVCATGLGQAKLQAQAQKIQSEAELEETTQRQEMELGFLRRRNDLEILQAREMAQLERDQFTEHVATIGRDTIVKLAQAGPEMQVPRLPDRAENHAAQRRIFLFFDSLRVTASLPTTPLCIQVVGTNAE